MSELTCRYRNIVLFRGVATANYFRSNEGFPPDPPTNDSRVETRTRMYYESARVEGDFTLIPPPPSTYCTITDLPGLGWEIDNFTLTPTCTTCVVLLWSLPNAGYEVTFGVLNPVNNY